MYIYRNEGVLIPISMSINKMFSYMVVCSCNSKHNVIHPYVKYFVHN